MKHVLWVTGAAAAAALGILFLADGIVEVAGYELLVLGVGGAAIWTLWQMAPERDEHLDPLIAGIGTSRSRRRPPQLTRVEWLVEFATSTSFDADYRLLPELRTIATERLKGKRGIELYADRGAARRVLGDEAWELLDPDREAQRVGKGIDWEKLDALVTAIERV